MLIQLSPCTHVPIIFPILTSSCDADPSALAKYVVALVKKDKSEKELKALCIDQLDVFLQKGWHLISCYFNTTSRN